MRLERSIGRLIGGMLALALLLGTGPKMASAQWAQVAPAGAAQQTPLLPGPVCTGEPGDLACGCDPEVQDCGCTSIQVSKGASTDGSVMTAHSCDGNYRTWLQIEPARENARRHDAAHLLGEAPHGDPRRHAQAAAEG